DAWSVVMGVAGGQGARFLVDVFAAFFAVDFLAVVFFAVDFLAPVFFAPVFLAPVLAVFFVALAFLAVFFAGFFAALRLPPTFLRWATAALPVARTFATCFLARFRALRTAFFAFPVASPMASPTRSAMRSTVLSCLSSFFPALPTDSVSGTEATSYHLRQFAISCTHIRSERAMHHQAAAELSSGQVTPPSPFSSAMRASPTPSQARISFVSSPMRGGGRFGRNGVSEKSIVLPN